MLLSQLAFKHILTSITLSKICTHPVSNNTLNLCITGYICLPVHCILIFKEQVLFIFFSFYYLIMFLLHFCTICIDLCYVLHNLRYFQFMCILLKLSLKCCINWNISSSVKYHVWLLLSSLICRVFNYNRHAKINSARSVVYRI